jgi:hypothetical protein
VAEAGRRLRLAAKTLDGFFVLKAILANNLDGDDLLIAQLAGPVDNTHAAAADFLENFEPGK